MIDQPVRIVAFRLFWPLVLVGQIVQSQELACAFQPGEKTYSQEYRQSFAGHGADRKRFELFGKQAEDCVRFEPEGLRITLPKDLPMANLTNGIAADIVVKGDFEITVSFEVLLEPEPAGGRDKQARFTLDIVLDTPGLNAASLSRTVYGKGVEYVAWSAIQKEVAGKPKISMDYIPTKLKKGCLRLARKGSDLSYYGSDAPDGEFKHLRKHAFGAEDLRTVRFVCSSGAADASFDVRVTDLLIRADAIPNMPAPTPEGASPTDSPQNIGGRGSIVVLLSLGMGLTFLLAIALGAWLFIRQRNRREDAPSAKAKAHLYTVGLQQLRRHFVFALALGRRARRGQLRFQDWRQQLGKLT